MFRDALAQVWRSPALLGILFVEFVALFIASIGFALIPVASLGVAIAILVIQLVLSLLFDAVVTAGFSGMVRNAVEDGSTTIREFLPALRRYWTRFVGYFIIRAAIIILLAIPFIISVIDPPIAGYTGFHYAWFAFFAVASALVAFFWLLWTAAIIVFDDAQTLDALKDSIRFTRAHPWITARTALACAGVMLAMLVLSTITSMPYRSVMAGFTEYDVPTPGVLALGAATDIVSFILFSMAVIVCAAYVLGTYRTMSQPASRKARRKARASR